MCNFVIFSSRSSGRGRHRNQKMIPSGNSWVTALHSAPTIVHNLTGASLGTSDSTQDHDLNNKESTHRFARHNEESCCRNRQPWTLRRQTQKTATAATAGYEGRCNVLVWLPPQNVHRILPQPQPSAARTPRRLFRCRNSWLFGAATFPGRAKPKSQNDPSRSTEPSTEVLFHLETPVL